MVTLQLLAAGFGGIRPQVNFQAPMDNSLNSDESYDLGYLPSPSSMDQSAAETSTMSSDSFLYRRTNSNASAFSESAGDSSYSGEASPSCWPNVKSTLSNQAVLSRLGMKKRMNFTDDKLEDHEAVDSGGFHCLFIKNLSTSLHNEKE